MKQRNSFHNHPVIHTSTAFVISRKILQLVRITSSQSVESPCPIQVHNEATFVRSSSKGVGSGEAALPQSRVYGSETGRESSQVCPPSNRACPRNLGVGPSLIFTRNQENPTRSAAAAILALYIPCPSPDATDTAPSAVSIALSDASPETLAPQPLPRLFARYPTHAG